MTVKVTTDVLTALTELGVELRVNMFNDDVEINGQPITDNLRLKLEADLQDQGVTSITQAWRVIVREALKSEYNPLGDYFTRVSYDGGKYIKRLADCFVAEDCCFYAYLRRWLIGAVRRAIQGGHQNFVLVLAGDQRIGKSQFVKWLVPPQLRLNHFREGPINPDNPDHHMELWSRLIWEVSELGTTTRRADNEALKHFLTAEQVSQRKPYGRYTISKPSRTSFIGTVNPTGYGFLNDKTGSRRFVVCDIRSIDWQTYTMELTPDLIWGEAYALYLGGEPAELQEEEIQWAVANNENHEIEKPVDIYIERFFERDPSGTNFIASYEICDVLRVFLKSPENLILQRFRRISAKEWISKGKKNNRRP